MSNTVNPDNFNKTVEGYIIRAFKDGKYTREQFDEFMSDLHWAFDMMDMEQARNYYDKYYEGNVAFDK